MPALAHARGARRPTPAWRDRAAARRAVPSRSTCPSIAARLAASAASTPSTRFSSIARNAPSGVRSSCDTFATRSRRTRSTSARSAAMRLKARPSSPTSSREVAVTRRSYSPRDIARAALTISRNGNVMPWASSCTMPSASTTAVIPVRNGERPARSPSSTTNTVTITAATMTTPSLSLIDERKSSGLTGRSCPVRSRCRGPS